MTNSSASRPDRWWLSTGQSRWPSSRARNLHLALVDVLGLEDYCLADAVLGRTSWSGWAAARAAAADRSVVLVRTMRIGNSWRPACGPRAGRGYMTRLTTRQCGQESRTKAPAVAAGKWGSRWQTTGAGQTSARPLHHSHSRRGKNYVSHRVREDADLKMGAGRASAGLAMIGGMSNRSYCWVWINERGDHGG